MPKKSTKALNNQTFKIGAKINGIKKIGFKISGAPNKIGSLTPKITGIELRNQRLPCQDPGGKISRCGFSCGRGYRGRRAGIGELRGSGICYAVRYPLWHGLCEERLCGPYFH